MHNQSEFSNESVGETIRVDKTAQSDHSKARYGAILTITARAVSENFR